MKKFFKAIGPGVITGASDDDPSGIATYSQAGAKFGYGLLWMSLFTIPLMMSVQEMSARLSLVTGRGVGGLIRSYVSKRAAIFAGLVLLITNTINIGADLGAMAAAIRLILPVPGWISLIVLAAVIIYLQVKIPYKQYVSFLRWFTITLLAYVGASFFINHEWSIAIGHTIVPSLPPASDVWLMVVAVLGTTISPYLFFWQASEEVEEEIAEGRTTVKERVGVTPFELRQMRRDVAGGMVFSNLIMFFIILTAAGTLFTAGYRNIETAADAAAALRPIAGPYASFFFAAGIIGTGLLAVPILAGSASYALSEVFRWREGLSKQFHQARRFYITIIGSIVFGMAMNASGISPIRFLIVAAVLNGLLAPLMLWHIIRLADDRRVVGEHRSPPTIRWGGWLTFAVMVLCGGILIVDLMI